jgi:hypothetical protein
VPWVSRWSSRRSRPECAVYCASYSSFPRSAHPTALSRLVGMRFRLRCASPRQARASPRNPSAKRDRTAAVSQTSRSNARTFERFRVFEDLPSARACCDWPFGHSRVPGSLRTAAVSQARSNVRLVERHRTVRALPCEAVPPQTHPSLHRLLNECQGPAAAESLPGHRTRCARAEWPVNMRLRSGAPGYSSGGGNP